MKIVFKITSIIIAIFCLSSLTDNLIAQQNMRDVVYLKKGSIVKGIIIEHILDVSYKIETADGSVFVYAYSEIEKVTKEQMQNEQNEQNQQYSKVLIIREKNPAVACVASIILPGLGQVANQEYGKAALFFLGTAGGVLLASSDTELAVLGAIVFLGCYLGSIIEAPVSASSYNKKLLQQINIGGVQFLSLAPDISVKQFEIGKHTLSYGVSINLNF